MPRIPLLASLLALSVCARPTPAQETAQEAAPSRPTALAIENEPALARRLEALAVAVDELRAELHLPGLALAIVQDDRLILARGFGLADLEGARAVTPTTTFAIGSTTKAFTATLAGILADEGKLAFDDPITKHIPWFELPIQGQGPVRLTDLLAHRTGFARMDVLWYGGVASREEILRTALGAEPLAPLGTRFLYNNIMYLAAGEACAAAGGKSWEELVRARLLEPLGMAATTTSVAEARRSAELALGHTWDEDEQRFERQPMRELHAIAPAGALNSNVLDLARWMRFLLAGGELEGRRLISAERLAETWTSRNTVAPQIDYGLGWMLGQWRGQRMDFHDGNIDGFTAAIALLPEKRTGVVLLANVAMAPLQSVFGAQVFAALFGEPVPAATPGEAAPADDDARFLGIYRANFFQFRDSAFEVRQQNGKLAVDIPGQTVYELGPPDARGRRPFALLPDQIQVSFVEDDARVVALVLHQGGFDFECYRPDYEPPSEFAPGELEPYLGRYADPLTKKNFALVVQHGRLAVDYPEQMVYELFPPDERERWLFRSSAQFAIEFEDEGPGEPPARLVFHERGTQRTCERLDGPAAPAALPTLDALMALRAEAFEARLASLGTCRLEGSLRLVSCGIRGTATSVFEPGERFRDETDLSPFVRANTVYDGTRAVTWSSLSAPPENELLGDNLDQARAGNLPALLGDWRKRFDQAVVLRQENDEGRELVQVRLRKGAAPPLLVSLDSTSGDLVRAEIQELVDGMGALPKSVRFEDWRELEGLRLPMRVVSEDEGTGRTVLEYTALTPGVSETWTHAGTPK